MSAAGKALHVVSFDVTARERITIGKIADRAMPILKRAGDRATKLDVRMDGHSGARQRLSAAAGGSAGRRRLQLRA